LAKSLKQNGLRKYPNQKLSRLKLTGMMKNLRKFHKSNWCKQIKTVGM